MDNLIKDLEEYSKKMIESSEKLQILAEQQMQSLNDMVESMEYAKIEWEKNNPVAHEVTPIEDFAREEFDQLNNK